MTNTTRVVYIEMLKGTHFVFYADRKKFGRYAAAQFAVDMRTREEVIEWVKERGWILVSKQGE